MDEKIIKTSIDKLKAIIYKNVKRKKYDRALSNIYACASILYSVNYVFVDEDLENALRDIAGTFNIKVNTQNDDGSIIFYDGFGLNDRGLAQIYLKALTKCYRVIYITDEKNKCNIPDILDIVYKNGEVVYLKKKKLYDKVVELQKIVDDNCPGKFIFYSYPQDVVGITCMHMYNGIIDRYNINLTDHAFWLGTKAIDYNIEFRDYGASISKLHRGIDEKKLIKNPFYPNINQNIEFEGFPFDENQKKIIFSGGSLYKTFGDNNKYYYMVEQILQENDNVIFWYAGTGDSSELDKLKNKYKDRVFQTKERRDLYQVLKHSDLYLSTYPICGGLMFQYAAAACKVPITLKYDDISNDFLNNQSELNIEFDELEPLLCEVKKLLSDDAYMYNRCKEIGAAVTTEDQFNAGVEKVFGKNVGEYIHYNDDTKIAIKDEYIKNYTMKKFCDNITSKWTIDIGIHFLKESILSVIIKFARVAKRIKNKVFYR